MSINTNLSYLFFLKESGIDTFLQNEPNNLYNEKIIIKDKERFESKKNLSEIITLDDNWHANVNWFAEAGSEERER